MLLLMLLLLMLLLLLLQSRRCCVDSLLLVVRKNVRVSGHLEGSHTERRPSELEMQFDHKNENLRQEKEHNVAGERQVEHGAAVGKWMSRKWSPHSREFGLVAKEAPKDITFAELSKVNHEAR